MIPETVWTMAHRKWQKSGIEIRHNAHMSIWVPIPVLNYVTLEGHISVNFVSYGPKLLRHVDTDMFLRIMYKLVEYRIYFCLVLSL